MRKAVGVVLLAAVLLFAVTAFVSCKKDESRLKAAASQRFSGAFSCSASIVCKGRQYVVEYSRTADGDSSLKFSKPAELSSLDLLLGKSGLTIKYGSLSTVVDPSCFPQASFIHALDGVFDSAASDGRLSLSPDGRRASIKGRAESGPFTLELDKSMSPTRLTIPSLGLKADFTSFRKT